MACQDVRVCGWRLKWAYECDNYIPLHLTRWYTEHPLEEKSHGNHSGERICKLCLTAHPTRTERVKRAQSLYLTIIKTENYSYHTKQQWCTYIHNFLRTALDGCGTEDTLVLQALHSRQPSVSRVCLHHHCCTPIICGCPHAHEDVVNHLDLGRSSWVLVENSPLMELTICSELKGASRYTYKSFQMRAMGNYGSVQ